MSDLNSYPSLAAGPQLVPFCRLSAPPPTPPRGCLALCPVQNVAIELTNGAVTRRGSRATFDVSSVGWESLIPIEECEEVNTERISH